MYFVGGFLGSGKTTAIALACRILIREGKRVGVVTNDQGKLQVDSLFMRSAGLPTVEVGGGCFCCRYDDFDARVSSPRREGQARRRLRRIRGLLRRHHRHGGQALRGLPRELRRGQRLLGIRRFPTPPRATLRAAPALQRRGHLRLRPPARGGGHTRPQQARPPLARG